MAQTGFQKCVWGGGGMMISDFKNNTANILRANARERSDQGPGSEATERGEGVGGGCPPPLPTVGRFLNFRGQNHVIWCMQ